MAEPRRPAVTEEALADAVARMSNDEAAYFLAKLETALRRRKLQLVGQLVACVGAVIGLVVALAVYGGRSPGQFVGWVFLLPVGLAGLSLLVFGRWADRVGAHEPAVPPVAPRSPP
ncbi:MAG: hypothetical protein R2939_20965 [Kofleriaceae bacterium]